jgi:hypothetical protein
MFIFFIADCKGIYQLTCLSHLRKIFRDGSSFSISSQFDEYINWKKIILRENGLSEGNLRKSKHRLRMRWVNCRIMGFWFLSKGKIHNSYTLFYYTFPSIPTLSNLLTHTLAHTYVPPGQGLTLLPVFIRNAYCCHMPEAIVIQKSQVNKDHLHFFDSSHLPFHLGPGCQIFKPPSFPKYLMALKLLLFCSRKKMTFTLQLLITRYSLF